MLLAENRLSSPVEDKATALRAGFLGQFLVIIAAFTALAWFGPPAARIVEPLAALCLLHLAVVATFTVSEDFEVSRRVKRRMQARGWWRLPGALFWPGGGRGAAYVLAQMAALLLAAWRLADWPADVRWVLAGCGYICFFTGGPAMVLRYLRPGIRSFFIRVAALVLLSASLVLPDILYYLFVRPETFSLAYSGRHLLNPIRTLTNWNIVEAESLFAVPQVLGMLGLLSYIALMFMNSRATEPDAGPLITELNRAGSR